MRLLLRLILLLALLLPPALIAVAWLALAGTPLVAQTARLSHQDIARAKTILKRNDPRGMPAGRRQSIRLDAQDLNLACNYLLQKYADARVHLDLQPGVMHLAATWQIPSLPARHFLNLSADLQADDPAAPHIHQLRIGELAIPDAFAQWLFSRALQRARASPRYRLLSDMVKDLQIEKGRVQLSYEWHPQLLDAVRSEVLSPQQQAAIVAYHQRLLGLQHSGPARRGQMVDVLPPLFQLAQQRSSEPGHAPADENRALLLVLGSWASGRSLDRLLPVNQRQRRPAAFRLTLRGRRDLAQHFLVSAALAAAGDTALADAVGLYKELSDSRGGSGFSFADLAADRAGSRLGQLAVATAAGARYLQRQLAGSVGEAMLMPVVDDLPEQLSADQFKHRFGSPESPAYRALLQDIDRRIERCPLYRHNPRERLEN